MTNPRFGAATDKAYRELAWVGAALSFAGLLVAVYVLAAHAGFDDDAGPSSEDGERETVTECYGDCAEFQAKRKIVKNCGAYRVEVRRELASIAGSDLTPTQLLNVSRLGGVERVVRVPGAGAYADHDRPATRQMARRLCEAIGAAPAEGGR